MFFFTTPEAGKKTPKQNGTTTVRFVIHSHHSTTNQQKETYSPGIFQAELKFLKFLKKRADDTVCYLKIMEVVLHLEKIVHN